MRTAGRARAAAAVAVAVLVGACAQAPTAPEEPAPAPLIRSDGARDEAVRRHRELAREARAVVEAAGPAPGHVFNLGHGIVPGTPPENVAALVETVHTASAALRR